MTQEEKENNDLGLGIVILFCIFFGVSYFFSSAGDVSFFFGAVVAFGVFTALFIALMYWDEKKELSLIGLIILVIAIPVGFSVHKSDIEKAVIVSEKAEVTFKKTEIARKAKLKKVDREIAAQEAKTKVTQKAKVKATFDALSPEDKKLFLAKDLERRKIESYKLLKKADRLVEEADLTIKSLKYSSNRTYTPTPSNNIDKILSDSGFKNIQEVNEYIRNIN